MLRSFRIEEELVQTIDFMQRTPPEQPNRGFLQDSSRCPSRIPSFTNPVMRETLQGFNATIFVGDSRLVCNPYFAVHRSDQTDLIEGGNRGFHDLTPAYRAVWDIENRSEPGQQKK